MTSKFSLLIIDCYSENYPRNKVLVKCLKNNFEIVEKNIKNSGFKRYYQFVKIIFQFGKKNDYIFLMQPAQRFIFLVLFYRIFFKTKIIFDAFISIFDTFVLDRKLANKNSLKGYYYFLLDYLCCLLADIIIFDTEENKNFFSDKFNIIETKEKIILPVSVDLEFIDSIIASPDDPQIKIVKNKFNILFYGSYIPLQGVEYIIKAASLLRNEKDLVFILIGSGQTYEAMLKLSKNLSAKNIVFVDRINYGDLIKNIKLADMCLGLFGNTEKAKRVISNKVIDYFSCGKIVVSGQNEAMLKYFKDEEDLLYCAMADEKDLADKILRVYNKYKDFEILGKNCRKKIENNFSQTSLELKVRAIKKNI